MENRLREVRESRGLSQTELARLSNIHRVTIARYETGKTVPGSENLFKLASALKCTAEEIITRKAG